MIIIIIRKCRVLKNSSYRKMDDNDDTTLNSCSCPFFCKLAIKIGQLAILPYFVSLVAAKPYMEYNGKWKNDV